MIFGHYWKLLTKKTVCLADIALILGLASESFIVVRNDREWTGIIQKSIFKISLIITTYKK